jgi:hypothetical protein
MGSPQEPLHGGLERVAHARSGKAMSGTRTCAQQGHAGDGEQRPLVPRSRCSPRLMPGVRRQHKEGETMSTPAKTPWRIVGEHRASYHCA